MSSATAGIALTPAASKICGRLFHYTSGIAAPTAAVSVCSEFLNFWSQQIDKPTPEKTQCWGKDHCIAGLQFNRIGF